MKHTSNTRNKGVFSQYWSSTGSAMYAYWKLYICMGEYIHGTHADIIIVGMSNRSMMGSNTCKGGK